MDTKYLVEVLSNCYDTDYHGLITYYNTKIVDDVVHACGYQTNLRISFGSKWVMSGIIFLSEVSCYCLVAEYNEVIFHTIEELVDELRNPEKYTRISN